MRVKRLFPHEGIGYDDYLRTVKSIMDDRVVFCSKNCIEVGVESLTKINDEERQKRLISSSILMDKIIDERNHSLKIPTVLTLANFMANYYDKIRRLNDDELVTLGLFSCVVDPLYMEEHLDLFTDKEILKSTMSKTIIHNEQIAILSLIEEKYDEFLVNNENKEGLEKFKKDSIMLIKNSSKEELLSMVKTPQEIEKELAEQGFWI